MLVSWVPVTRYEQNCSILGCEATRKAAVIDPGGDLHLVEGVLEWEGLDLDLVLVTHGHFDHAGAAAELASRHGARLEGPHPGDAHLLKALTAQAARRGLKAGSYEPQRWLANGDLVQFGDETLQVLHCPGHTRGHVVYFHPVQRVAFVGDILFQGAIGAWEHADGDLRRLIETIRERLFPLGDDVMFVPGHGETSTFGRERRQNPFVGDDMIARLQRAT